jgi:hypothetical protein
MIILNVPENLRFSELVGLFNDKTPGVGDFLKIRESLKGYEKEGK